ncbi:unnamed protein product [Urochloa humidicola]
MSRPVRAASSAKSGGVAGEDGAPVSTSGRHLELWVAIQLVVEDGTHTKGQAQIEERGGYMEWRLIFTYSHALLDIFHCPIAKESKTSNLGVTTSSYDGSAVTQARRRALGSKGTFNKILVAYGHTCPCKGGGTQVFCTAQKQNMGVPGYRQLFFMQQYDS